MEEEMRLGSSALRASGPRRDVMVEPDEVTAMLRLKQLGWGTRRIATELGVSRGTVQGYIEAGGWRPFQQPARKKRLDSHEAWLKERFRLHRGNADVVRQELAAEKAITVSLRTVERAVEPYRRSWKPRRGRPCGSRRRRASRCRSTSANAWS